MDLEMTDEQNHVVVWEIERIVSSSYPVALKKLHFIFREQGEAAQYALRQWTCLYPSRARVLASAVLDGLSLWPYTIDLLECLSAVHQFRDILLHSNDGLIAQLLGRCQSSEQDFDRWSRLCIRLLADPLPANVSLPASAQAFFCQLFEASVRHASVETLEPVYLLLDGACQGLVDLLPQSKLDKWREHLTRMMRGVRSIEEQPLSLYCLAIIAKMNRCHKEASDVQQQHLSINAQPCKHSSNEISKFFTGDKALKTMQLLVLQVIYACRSNLTQCLQTRARQIRVARQALSAIDGGTRNSWAKANLATLQKLQEKLMQPSLLPEIQLEALTFASLLFDSNIIPDTLVFVFRRLILATPYQHHTRLLRDCMSTSLPSVAPRLDSGFWHDFLHEIFEVSFSQALLLQPKAALLTELLHTLRDQALNHDTSRNSILQALATKDLSQRMKAFPAQHVSSYPGLDCETCSFLLALAILTSESELRIDSSLSIRLVSRLASFGRNTEEDATLRRPVPTTMAPFSAIERDSHSDKLHKSRNWRQRLAIELGADAKLRQESVVKLVAQVCEDLEARCSNIEAPLLKKEEECQKLQHINDDLQELARGNDLQIEQLRADLKAVENSVSRKDEECQNSQGAIAQLQTAMREKEAQLVRLKGDLETTGANLSNQETQLAAASSKLKEATNLRAELERNLERAKSEAYDLLEKTRQDLQSQILELQTSVACQTEQSDIDGCHIAEMRREIEKKDKAGKIREEEHESMKRTLDETIEVLRNDVRTEKETLGRTLLEAKGRHNREINELTAKAKADQDFSETRLKESTKEFNETLLDLRNSLNSRFGENKELRKRIQDIEIELEETILQLQEAHKMKARLLIALGLEDTATTTSRHNTTSIAPPLEPFPGSPSPKRAKPRMAPFRAPLVKHATFATEPSTTREPKSRRSFGMLALGQTPEDRLNRTQKDRRRSEIPNASSSSKMSKCTVLEGVNSDHVTSIGSSQANRSYDVRDDDDETTVDF